MSLDQMETVAQDATFQVQCAMCQIDWLRSVLHVLEDRLKTAGDQHGSNLANLAIYNADDWHNALNGERESLEKRIDSAAAAPQKTITAKRGAPLVDGPSSAIGERLVLARTEAGLTQAKLAKMVGMEQASISMLETGETQRTTYLAELARACGVSADWLAFGPEVSA
ncbi:helix-turn-helix domain-containing protein [Pseudomonas sp. URMO17WK12:I11]|uniref:helix-turn-helix domain-containing protein n=1 Tax=Pseudomonas sp. URMO17WK12:I11 TaxID=1283291 RepID=UPI002114E350|nr:helix-turn-helix transcriptional regulator [Pseudomonas sp. URMO17WK12:I11]